MLDKQKMVKMMAEMAAVGAKYGYQVSPAGGTLGQGATDAKIKFAVKEISVGPAGKVAVVVSGCAKNQARFDSIDLDKTFTVNGKTHRVIDFHPRKYKTPWITECTQGKNWKWSADMIRRYQATS